MYWKIIHLYEHQQETKVPFLAILGTFWQKSTYKYDKTST